jgi:hypothetical protein
VGELATATTAGAYGRLTAEAMWLPLCWSGDQTAHLGSAYSRPVGCASVQRVWIASGRLRSHPRRVRSSWRASGKASACAAQTFSRGPSVPAQTVTVRASCPAARRTLTRWVLRLWVLPPLTGGRARRTASGQRQTDLGGSQLKLGERIDIAKC